MKKSWLVGTTAVLAIMTSTPVYGGVSYNGTRGLIRTKSADTIGKGMLNFQVSSYYYMYNDSLLRPGRFNFGDPGTENAIVDYHFILTRATLTIGLSDYLEVGANLDVRNWIRVKEDNGGHTSLENFTRGGIGDLDLSGKFRVPIQMPNVRLGGYGMVSAPTGSKKRGFTTDSWDFLFLGLGTLDFTDLDAFVPTRLHLNAGYRLNRNEDNGYGVFQSDFPEKTGFHPPAYPLVPTGENNSFNDLFIFNTAIEFPAPQVTFFVEFTWEQLINAEMDSLKTLGVVAADASENTFTITPGLGLNFPRGYELKAAADINLNGGGSPSYAGPADWALWLMVSGAGPIIPQDRDHDGVPDKQDKCPDQAEDRDGFQDDDGCPDPDNDGDGIPDVKDKCPDLAEDQDGFEDEDGCPDLDNDQDGIPDAKDKCPNEPEDFDGDQDDDGCPDLVKDSDNDRIPDDIDRCPLQAEDIDGFQDDDGCPDLDNDLDGIPDAEDKCPNAPETFNGYMDDDGCPDEKPIEEKFILKGVNFESGSSALTPDSYRVLDEVVRSLLAYPEVRIEIQGYTDSVGKASYNLELSDRRAGAVKQYLVNAGVDPSRLVAKGYGESDPVGNNSTPEGRAQNRRIEFKRLN